jgi:hypothetical protein
MSDVRVVNRLEVRATIGEGFAIGAKNIGPILVNILLWLVTIWIPYLNVGTTIGLAVGIVSKAAKGEPIPIIEIFDPRYRKYMGEFFLTSGLVCMGVTVGTIFGIIPGIVIGLAWSLSLLIAIDKDKNPTEAIALSNHCTYGRKWSMIGIWLLTLVMFGVVQGILIGIGVAVDNSVVTGIMACIVVLLVIFETFVFIGIQASMYRQLSSGI